MNISDLEKLGLEKKEARAYLACLEMGSGTAFQVAKKIGVPKSTAHDILNNLVSKGLASTYLKRNKKFFSASDPLIMGERAKAQLNVFERILPELRALAYTGVNKPRVRYFDTEVGIEVAMKEMIAEAKELFFYGNVDAIFEAYPEYFPRYMQLRVKMGIPSRGIAQEGPLARKMSAEDAKFIRKTKFLSSLENLSSLAWMWEDKFVIFNTIGDHSVLIVEDKRFAKLLRSMFETMWQST